MPEQKFLSFKAKSGLSLESRDDLLRRIQRLPDVEVADWNSAKASGVRGTIILRAAADIELICHQLGADEALESAPTEPARRSLTSGLSKN
jgi:hypothetical protein